MNISPEKKRMLRFYATSVTLLIALAIIGLFMADQWGLISTQPTVSTDSSVSHKGARDIAYVDVPRMTVSLGGSASTRMQVDITLEVPKKDAAVLEGYLPQIMDRLNAYLPRIKIEDIGRPDAMFMLHKDMLWQINNIGIPVLVQDVMLQNMIIL